MDAVLSIYHLVTRGRAIEHRENGVENGIRAKSFKSRWATVAKAAVTKQRFPFVREFTVYSCFTSAGKDLCCLAGTTQEQKLSRKKREQELKNTDPTEGQNSPQHLPTFHGLSSIVTFMFSSHFH